MMKKLLVMLLVFAMVLPMCLGVNAESEEHIIPFTMVNWGGIEPEWGIDNVVAMPMFWTSQKVKPEKWTVQYRGKTTIPEIAKLLKEDFDKIPEGARYINFMGLGAAIRLYAEEVVFLDKSEKQIHDWVSAFVKEYHRIGGKLDGFILDIEYLEMFYYYFNVKYAEKDLLMMNRIVNDDRYKEVIRPMLVERGFKFWEKITEYTPEIYSMNRTAGSKNEQRIWDSVMQEVQNGVIWRAAVEPLTEYYPNAIVSDYKVKDNHTWYTGGVNVGSNTSNAGNASNDNMYYNKPGDDFFKSYNKLPSYNDTVYECSPFNQALSEIVSAKRMWRSTDNHRLNVWFCGFDYTGVVNSSGVSGAGGENPFKPAANTAYYSEIMYHIGLLNPEPFVGWITQESYGTGTNMKYLYTVVSQILHKLTDLVGAADRKPIDLPYNDYNSKFLLSGMYAGGRNIWRITPDTNVISVADFKVADSDPTFYVKGQTVTFPGGKIIAESPVDDIGTCGYWVETAEDVYPVITNDADRLEAFPALRVDFEDHAVGAFDYLTSLPAKAWDIAWEKDKQAQIVDLGGNKALSFTGDFSLRSQQLPLNVTAGDTYAEKQAWEATITLPEGLSEEAEINLLAAYKEKQTDMEDGGFKIAGGKVYYDEEGEFIELADISAGTYRFVRNMDFSDKENITSDYYVFDAEGKLLASAMDKKTTDIKVPVYAVGLETYAVNGDVLLDDFVLRVTGLATDLFLYDAKFGTEHEDITKAQTVSTAYRLSWMNPTAKESTVKVMAAIYEGDTLVSETAVKEVVMKPGYDNVETGIVEIAEGQTVKIYLVTEIGAEEDDIGGVSVNKPSGDKTPAPGGTDKTVVAGDAAALIVIIVAAAVLCAAGICYLLLVAKKKKQ